MKKNHTLNSGTVTELLTSRAWKNLTDLTHMRKELMHRILGSSPRSQILTRSIHLPYFTPISNQYFYIMKSDDVKIWSIKRYLWHKDPCPKHLHFKILTDKYILFGWLFFFVTDILISPQITQCWCPPICTGIKLESLETAKTEMSGGSFLFSFLLFWFKM